MNGSVRTRLPVYAQRMLGGEIFSIGSSSEDETINGLKSLGAGASATVRETQLPGMFLRVASARLSPVNR